MGLLSCMTSTYWTEDADCPAPPAATGPALRRPSHRGERRRALDADRDLAAYVTLPQAAYRVRDFGQRVRTVHHRGERAGLQELPQDAQVLGAGRGGEAAQAVAGERRQQQGPQLPVVAADPAAVGLAADDDQRPARVSARRSRWRGRLPAMSRTRS